MLRAGTQTMPTIQNITHKSTRILIQNQDQIWPRAQEGQTEGSACRREALSKGDGSITLLNLNCLVVVGFFAMFQSTAGCVHASLEVLISELKTLREYFSSSPSQSNWNTFPFPPSAYINSPSIFDVLFARLLLHRKNKQSLSASR